MRQKQLQLKTNEVEIVSNESTLRGISAIRYECLQSLEENFEL
jgi:hypothetical protein